MKLFADGNDDIRSSQRVVTMTVLLAKAAAMALVQHPVVNASCKDGKSFTYTLTIATLTLLWRWQLMEGSSPLFSRMQISSV